MDGTTEHLFAWDWPRSLGRLRRVVGKCSPTSAVIAAYAQQLWGVSGKLRRTSLRNIYANGEVSTEIIMNNRERYLGRSKETRARVAKCLHGNLERGSLALWGLVASRRQ